MADGWCSDYVEEDKEYMENTDYALGPTMVELQLQEIVQRACMEELTPGLYGVAKVEGLSSETDAEDNDDCEIAM
jgi:hypothetical protein